MLEWLPVATTNFTNAQGVQTAVKLIHEFTGSDSVHKVEPGGRDLDLIAYDELQTEAESLNLLEANAVNIVEYDFNLAKIKNLIIP
jgi:hypothetical protein